MRGKVLVLTVVVAFAAGAWLNNSALIHNKPDGGRMTLVAHRGMHQNFNREGVDANTCTATRIKRPAHWLLENTLSSMDASFATGADIVELDVHPTTDGQFAVIHDWSLECRTNGKGATREHSMAELKQLDIGYGYTADGGRTFPFRGKGVGQMPTLNEVLARFPQRKLLIHIKGNEPKDGELLAARLAKLSAEQRSLLMVYGPDAPVNALRAKLPGLITMSKGGAKMCLAGYAALGWSGHVPESCRNTLLLIPINVAPWIWGYPHLLMARMKAAGTQVFITGPYSGGEFSTGVDDAETFAKLPKGFSGGVWTNRIEVIAGLAR